MRRVLATAGHVDHGKSTLVRALTGRDPDRLAEEQARGLTIELGFAWTTLPDGTDVAFVDVPGHQRFVATTLTGLGPAPAVVFVVAADQGWQAQSSEHLAAVRALGIPDGLLVLARADLADEERTARTREEAERRLRGAGVTAETVVVSARTGAGVPQLREALGRLVARLPEPDPAAPVRLWCDRSFTVPGAGTVVTGTLGGGTLAGGDRLVAFGPDRAREVVVRGLHSADVARESVGPVSRVAVNVRRVEAADVPRGSVLVTPDAFGEAVVLDVAVAPVPLDLDPRPGRPLPPQHAVLHVGTTDRPVHVRPLGERHARLTLPSPLPWHVGDRLLLRDPGTRRLWSATVVDVDPLPLRRRGAARRRAEDLETGGPLADLRLRSRSAVSPDELRRLALPEPTAGARVGSWWVDEEAVRGWTARAGQVVRAQSEAQPLSAGVPVVELARRLDLPDHLEDLGPDLVRHVAPRAGLEITDGRVHLPRDAGLGPAEAAVAELEARLRGSPFAAPEREDLDRLGLGPAELAAAARVGRLLRLPDDVVLLPDAPARAMRELATLPQPFTLSEARQALGTTRRVAVPLLEHLDGRGWTRRLDGRLRQVVR